MPQYSAPTGAAKVSEHVARATLANEKAKAHIETIKATGAKPNDPVILELETINAGQAQDLGNAQTAIAFYKGEVQAQTSQLNASIDAKNAALDKAEYWHGKQVKALVELYFWRSAAMVIFLAVCGWVAFKLFKPSFV